MKFILFSNSLEIASLCDEVDKIDTIYIDLERLGKQERQFGRDTFISTHSVVDISNMSGFLRNTKLGVRVDPYNDMTRIQIADAVQRGCDSIMLPYFKTTDEVFRFIDYVPSHVDFELLFETKEAIANIDRFFTGRLPAYVHFGLNDLAIDLGLDSCMDVLHSHLFNEAIIKLQSSLPHVRYGIGGIGYPKISESYKIQPFELFQTYSKLGSQRVILSRSFFFHLRDNDLSAKGIANLLDLYESS